MGTNRMSDQQHARAALDEAFNRQNRLTSRCAEIDEVSSFCINPAEYEWKCLGKREMLLPYGCDSVHFDSVHDLGQPKLPNLGKMRWEQHHVWIVEGTLHRGESNLLARRRFYLDEDSWRILLGEGYDLAGIMIKYYMFCEAATSTTNKRGRWYLADAPEATSA